MDTSGTIVCPSCGAGVAKSAGRCAYCGSEVVLPKPKGAEGPAQRRTYCTRCGQLYPSSAARCSRCPPAAEGRKGTRCPRCAGTLELVSMGGVSVDRCAQCRGHWFDGDEVEHAVDLTTQGVSKEEAAALRRSLPPPSIPTEEVRYLACVRCGERMARRQAAPRSGVIVDLCREHGVWFDGDELERFAAFARAGGLEVLRHDGIAVAEARSRLAAEVLAGRQLLPPEPDLGGPFVGASVVVVLRSLLRGLR